jgi:hypothetical protein
LRGDKARKQTVYGRLEYQGGLSAQSFKQRHLVLYNAAGTNVSAAYFDRTKHPGFVVEHKLYWAAFSDEREAHYVAAVLNSDMANKAIKPFQSTGLLGERDIEKKLLELPIPTFDHENKAHTDIAKLGAQAHAEAAEVVSSGEFPIGSSLARQRGIVRLNLKSTMKKIDKLVVHLLKG